MIGNSRSPLSCKTWHTLSRLPEVANAIRTLNERFNSIHASYSFLGYHLFGIVENPFEAMCRIDDLLVDLVV